ncbi:hypothetical protein Tcan_14429 [Toxocara canis]|uniref:Uncharacterized protein n=1 Tax=Toxocara canis TaxID=6265 RepID=A0A0B2VMC5_TOXCA|nr:hypothetical protein Tcan_14429 [Toxocara canis]
MSGKGTQDSAEEKTDLLEHQSPLTSGAEGVSRIVHCCNDPLRGGGSLRNAFLGLKRLNGRHDAQMIKRDYLKILNSVDISESSIYRVATDSGAKNEYEVLHDEIGNAGCEEVTAVPQFQLQRMLQAVPADAAGHY